MKLEEFKIVQAKTNSDFRMFNIYVNGQKQINTNDSGCSDTFDMSEVQNFLAKL